MTIIDPHIKRDPGYYIYQEAEQSHYFVRNKDGTDYDGCCPASANHGYRYMAGAAAGTGLKTNAAGILCRWCWPGSSHYLDMLNPSVRQWWAQHFSLSKYKGSTPNLYVWNDMNEPSVFTGPEVLPKNSLPSWRTVQSSLHAR